jgi:hypothetical protein
LLNTVSGAWATSVDRRGKDPFLLKLNLAEEEKLISKPGVYSKIINSIAKIKGR